MFSRKKIKEPGDTTFAVGDIVEAAFLEEENARIKETGGTPAVSVDVVMGITDVSLSRKSFLAAASFQHTTRMLISSAIRGNSDKLAGLMENVILGRLIPAGTGFKGSNKNKMIEDLKASRASEYQYEEQNKCKIQISKIKITIKNFKIY